ncbi:MAG: hypothetical protein F6K25_24455 [Okeania sp. SIO2G4]|uniref:hypothetical protein n=1 Tax=unclassified Okeania TaxID=2634635 RepID=UPI0013B9C2FA|nr:MULTISPECIES: hypothetical protein [unclassified Okeania]NEP07087.1 hypothetical protein [Okeania sp. SIO4D6]NEP74823.1 hypothetical protein [Okeania sp. SIO2G5]NEP94293.1 hypothetical protein [Okeania sp. SIO2F5]NEQ93640.1 hypothetical protein [Okeania sp. SIO2G4]
MKLVAVAGSNHEQSSAPATNIPLVNVYVKILAIGSQKNLGIIALSRLEQFFTSI